MNIAFWGTPELTIPILEALAKSGLTPSVVITGPDRRVGRGLVLTPPAPKLWAEERGIRVIQPEKLDAAFLSELRSLNLDISVVVAYGKILSQELIDTPKHGTLNVHYSLLPRWRGATPVEAAILAGDPETGVCVQQMTYKLDAGDIHRYEKILIDEHETAPALRERLNVIGAELLCASIKDISSGTASPLAQDTEDVTACGKIKKEDGLVDPDGDPVENDRKFRAYYGWPGIYFFARRSPSGGGSTQDKQLRIKITDAILEDGIWNIKRVVPEGKKEISYGEFLKQK